MKNSTSQTQCTGTPVECETCATTDVRIFNYSIPRMGGGRDVGAGTDLAFVFVREEVAGVPRANVFLVVADDSAEISNWRLEFLFPTSDIRPAAQ